MITNLYDILKIYLLKLNQEIIGQNKYGYVEKLNIRCCGQIQNNDKIKLN